MRTYYTDLDRASGGQLLLFWVLVSKARIIDPNIQAILPRTPLRLGWRVAKEGRTLAKTENHLYWSNFQVELVLAFFHATLPICVLCLGFWGFSSHQNFQFPKGGDRITRLGSGTWPMVHDRGCFFPLHWRLFGKTNQVGWSLLQLWNSPVLFFWKRFSSNN